MRHRRFGRKLGRTSSHRLALLRSLAAELFTHESITTTVTKAKEARRFVERLITLGKRGGLDHRRRAAARLQNEAVAKKLFDDIAPRYADRPGGYTRILKLPKFRQGDAAQLCLFELVEKREVEKAADADKKT
jgi:large subunit ribosomal protein L17